jgi:hypothetical protein
MGIETNKKKDLSWNYYLTLVKELSTISDFIEFDEANYSTYSTELAKLLMAASSEVDVVLKQLCGSLNKKRKHRTIEDYKKTIKADAVAKIFINESVLIPRHGLELHPWDNWNGTGHPIWWNAYNKVKHERNNHFSKATLKNTLNAMGALLICIVYLRAVERTHLHNEGDYAEAIPYAWGELTPRDRFLRLDRSSYPLLPIE